MGKKEPLGPGEEAEGQKRRFGGGGNKPAENEESQPGAWACRALDALTLPYRNGIRCSVRDSVFLDI